MCQITSILTVCWTVFQASLEENIEAPDYWPLEGNLPVPGGLPSQRTNNAVNVHAYTAIIAMSA